MARKPSDALAECAWFTGLGPGLGATLLAGGRMRRLRGGDAVYRQGDPPDGLYAVLDGRVRLTFFTDHGTGQLLLIARPGDWFGEVSTLDLGPRQQHATCDEDATLFNLPMPLLERAGSEHPVLWRAIGRIASEHQRAAIAYLQSLASRAPAGRVAALLTALGGPSPGGPLHVTHEDIAASTGLSRQTVNSVLRRWERRSLVELGYRYVRITGDLEG